MICTYKCDDRRSDLGWERQETKATPNVGAKKGKKVK